MNKLIPYQLYSSGQQIKITHTSNTFVIEESDETGGMELGLVLFVRRRWKGGTERWDAERKGVKLTKLTNWG